MTDTDRVLRLDEIELQEKEAKFNRDTRARLVDRLIDDVKWVAGNAKGRRVFWMLLSVCNIFETTMTGDNHTFVNEGKRQIGLYLTRLLRKAGPMLLHQIEAEVYAEGMNNQIKRDKIRSGEDE